MPTDHQVQQGWNSRAQSIQVCRSCGLVCEDELRPADQQSSWSTLKEYRARVFVPPSQVFFTHTNCPDCFTRMGGTSQENITAERADGGRITTTEDSVGGADDALIALAEIILGQATKRVHRQGW